MNKLVSINRKFPGAYYARNDEEQIPEKVLLVAGVVISMLLQIFCAYAGLIPLFVSAGSALTGFMLGLAIYYKFPYRFTSLNVEKLPRAPTRREARLKKAA